MDYSKANIPEFKCHKAMEMGADAVKAVEVASKYVVGCGRGCDFGVSR